MEASRWRDGATAPPGGPAYSTSHRTYEYGGVLAGSTAGLWLLSRLMREPDVTLRTVVPAILVGMMEADLFSGTVHWVFDTWGTARTAIIGPLAIRTFREHHVDETAMLDHDFIETNGHNFALSTLLSCAGLLAKSPFAGWSFLVAAFFIAMTSQIHKWAHMDRPPLLPRLLQKARIILSRAHHRGHHEDCQTRNYCITTGWLDTPLRVLHVWEALEVTVTFVTGARPRAPT
jgi:ubiquitin-conjugating enzyme E2 variant